MATDALNDARDYITFPRQTFSAGLRIFQNDHKQWSMYNFGDTQTPQNMFLGMVEEIGELAHATLKHSQKIRGMESDEAFEKLAKDCIGDLFVFTVGYASARGWDMAEIVADTWERVRDRDFRTNPTNGGDVSPVTQGASG